MLLTTCDCWPTAAAALGTFNTCEQQSYQLIKKFNNLKFENGELVNMLISNLLNQIYRIRMRLKPFTACNCCSDKLFHTKLLNQCAHGKEIECFTLSSYAICKLHQTEYLDNHKKKWNKKMHIIILHENFTSNGTAALFVAEAVCTPDTCELALTDAEVPLISTWYKKWVNSHTVTSVNTLVIESKAQHSTVCQLTNNNAVSSVTEQNNLETTIFYNVQMAYCSSNLHCCTTNHLSE